MPSIKIFKNVQMIKYKVVRIKLQCYWHYVHHNSDKCEAKVHCLFTLCAVYAFKLLNHSVWSKRIKSCIYVNIFGK